MTVDIMAIGDQIIEYPNVATQTFVSTDEYVKIAQRLVRKIAPVYRPGLAEQILRSEDAISNIATQIMMADWRWNGNGTLYGYRKECVKWAIKGFIERDVARSKRRVLSLNNTTRSSDDDTQEYMSMIPGKDPNPADVVEQNESDSMKVGLIDQILGSGILTNTQEKCIRLHYLQGKSMSDIGRELGVSRQAVQDNVQRGISKLKAAANGSS
jgi:RNA polymerase sigma factor (sigma-70 family)